MYAAKGSIYMYATKGSVYTYAAKGSVYMYAAKGSVYMYAAKILSKYIYFFYLKKEEISTENVYRTCQITQELIRGHCPSV